MKLTFKQIEPFVKSPDPAARVILSYGPDQGLMKERSKIMCQSYIPDLNDPFNVVTMTSDQIMAEPSRFYDETQAQSLMGGNRLIIIKDGADGISTIIKEYLESPSSKTLVVIEAGDLGPKSALRKLCESAKNAAAVPCYVDDERNLSQIIRDMCIHAGYTINQDALITLSSALVGDRSIARNEIEKLLLYKGLEKEYEGFIGSASTQKKGQITLEDIYACSGDIRDWTIDKLIYAIGDGDIKTTNQIIQSLFRDQMPPMTLLRSAQNHFWRLYATNAKITSGQTMQEAVKALNPPLFFKVEDAFKRQLNRWPINALESALDALNKAEAMIKKTGYSDTSIVENCLIQLSRYNPRRRAA